MYLRKNSTISSVLIKILVYIIVYELFVLVHSMYQHPAGDYDANNNNDDDDVDDDYNVDDDDVDDDDYNVC